MVDDYSYDHHDVEQGQGNMLHVIDIQSGDILQTVRLELQGGVSEILVDGDEIYISSFGASKIAVLRFAGSEA